MFRVRYWHAHTARSPPRVKQTGSEAKKRLLTFGVNSACGAGTLHQLYSFGGGALNSVPSSYVTVFICVPECLFVLRVCFCLCVCSQ